MSCSGFVRRELGREGEIGLASGLAETQSEDEVRGVVMVEVWWCIRDSIRDGEGGLLL